eukprot:SAG22_NODE_13507_length_404_cov_0.796721_2_plen_26_part_01
MGSRFARAVISSDFNWDGPVLVFPSS